ncbi:PDDEXK nuclease domain-containing protein [Sphingobacterium faecale]|uniref:DUF1016 family protein n=1 Tax=Sphingobacterium faecale TaxID=2803775 RepID=A0ABS1R5G0_9SPHI|nr:PDDEXK nuclease domain-containing protein [Sphingobacterium faecale]MBL1409479.1 DUF1016 family protein [Sphingobacterium faecale]
MQIDGYRVTPYNRSGATCGKRVVQIESKLHERQGQAITNFDETLPKIQSNLAKQTLRNPYVFDFLSLSENVQERDMEKAIISEIRRLLLELGKCFAYLGNQYHLQVDNEDFYMDLLFYNFLCFARLYTYA